MISRAVLFVGGRVQSYAKIAEQLLSTDYIIAVDSGYSHCEALSLTPDILIGDFDSIENIPSSIPLISLPTAKAYTDIAHAIEHTIEKNMQQMLIVGALGGRFDHTLANIQAAVYASNRANVRLYDGISEVFVFNTAVNKQLVLKNKAEHYFSLIAHSDICANVSIEGAMYPLVSYSLTNVDPRAVSNEFVGNDVNLSASSGTLLVIVEPKND